MNRLYRIAYGFHQNLIIHERFALNNFRKCSTTPVSDKFQENIPENKETKLNSENIATNLAENEEIKVLKDKIVDLEDKYKRSLAETENLRIRMLKQIEDAKIFGIQNFCKDLIEIADILTKAKESFPKDKIAKNEPFKAYYEGLTMTEAQLMHVFRKHGLVQIDALGKKFNPNEHESLFELENNDVAPGCVAVVTKIGYKLHDRTIRPSSVGIAKLSSGNPQ